ncbi:permease-like cell division protein FtsX [Candidatus Saccharibacteria bacterium]|nr:permease-like cell division protein FtsX [Candidatus Saccharibacteria bacterium]
MTTSRRYHTTLRIFKSGFTNLFRNAWLTIAATAVMVVALTIISIAVVLNVTANNAIDELARDLKASIYITDTATEAQTRQLQSSLSSLDFIENVEFITQTQARSDLAGDFNNDSGILQALSLAGEDVLPASLRITVNDLKRMPEIKDFAEQDKFAGVVDSVSLGQTDAQATIDKAAAAQKFINIGSIISAVFLSAVSIMIIFNTIRMAIYTRRDEIRIMKLIGATPDYIRGPFLVEASLYGVFAGIISFVTVYSLVYSLGRKVAEQPEFSQTYNFFMSTSTMFLMFLSVVFLGILIGAISSMLAMEKHLKLKHW